MLDCICAALTRLGLENDASCSTLWSRTRNQILAACDDKRDEVVVAYWIGMAPV